MTKLLSCSSARFSSPLAHLLICVPCNDLGSLLFDVKMVGATEIAENNVAYTNEQHTGLVCVFAGATAGIGRATLERLATMVHSSTFYILGRNKQRHAAWLDHLRATSSNSKFIYVEAQASLISDIDEACDQILSAEERVDILCMSPGGMPFAGAKCMKWNRFPMSSSY